MGPKGTMGNTQTSQRSVLLLFLWDILFYVSHLEIRLDNKETNSIMYFSTQLLIKDRKALLTA